MLCQFPIKRDQYLREETLHHVMVEVQPLRGIVTQRKIWRIGTQTLQQHFQIEEAALRVGVVDFDVGEEEVVQGGGKFVSEDLRYGHT